MSKFPFSVGLQHDGTYGLGWPRVAAVKDYRLFLSGMFAARRWVNAAIIAVGSSLAVWIGID